MKSAIPLSPAQRFDADLWASRWAHQVHTVRNDDGNRRAIAAPLDRLWRTTEHFADPYQHPRRVAARAVMFFTSDKGTVPYRDSNEYRYATLQKADADYRELITGARERINQTLAPNPFEWGNTFVLQTAGQSYNYRASLKDGDLFFNPSRATVTMKNELGEYRVAPTSLYGARRISEPDEYIAMSVSLAGEEDLTHNLLDLPPMLGLQHATELRRALTQWRPVQDAIGAQISTAVYTRDSL